MPDRIKIFVSYSHQDADYLEENSLLGFLKGLEKENIEFWTDQSIRPGELWDEVIKTQIQDSHIALVLVSQGFLDSDYCQNTEIKHFLAHKAHLFPVILSPCDWRRHEWLKSRQFLPGGDQTVEEHFQDNGRRKRLFLQIREQLRERAELIRQSHYNGPSPPPPPGPFPGPFPGKVKIAFCDRLGDDWKRLADCLEIRVSDQARFERGDEGRGIWVWLENRSRLSQLPAALREIKRGELAELLENFS
ncbi:TIR protein [Nitrosococcus halophilus Nc 4]|uniref:TIR protein n=1 Tax=Nitrosococcus halophilus (strain Nc4) TaxID=472759 RepID=D5C179_NITHN|nr:TIR domain-containing protein [Nitrosococcus halophilus]ADE14636.1 TIR protein [Nitrosococcus halophilus Nc 4]